MKKRVLIAAVIIACAGIIAAISMAVISMEKKDKPIAFSAAYGLEDLSLLEAGAETEGSLCLVAPKDKALIFYETILGKYVIFQKAVGEKYKLPEKTESWEYIKKYNVDIIELYNFRTGQTEKEIDLVAIAQENTPGKQFRYNDPINGEVIDGREYIGWRVYPVEEPHDYRQAEIITYDLEEEKVVDYVKVNVPPLSGYTEEEKEYFKSFFLAVDWECNFFKINGFPLTPYDDEEGVYIDYTDSWRDGVIAVEMPASMLPENNARLYAEFPRLKEYEIKEGDKVKLFFAGYPDAEEIIRMLLEDGTELTYEGCMVSGISSIDGQQHEISCIDDYIKWCNWKLVDPELVE